jgi:hypothetical protein
MKRYWGRIKMALSTFGYRRIIYLLVLIFAVAPMIFPFGLPVRVSVQTRDLYDYIENLEPGSVVAINFAAFAGMYPDAQAATRAVLIHLFRRPIKFVLWHSGPDGPMLFENEIVHVDKRDKVYGEDYVYLPYVGGGENTLAAMAENMRGIFSVDIYGTPIDDIPLMENINEAEDFDLILVLADSGGADQWAVRQWTIPHGIPEGGTPISISYPDLIPYWESGLIVGMTNGVRGGGEYELLIDVPGPGLRRTDVLSSVHILFILLILAGNTLSIVRKEGGGF